MEFITLNCPHLGCDPTRVTIFGQGSGATAVHHQILHERSNELFDGAIMQSGAGFTDGSLTQVKFQKLFYFIVSSQ